MPRETVAHRTIGYPDWSIGEVTQLSAGLNSTIPQYDIDDEEWSDVTNMVPRQGKAVIDTGYRPLTFDPWTTPKTQQTVIGNPRLIAEHVDINDAKIQVLITNKTAYKLAVGAMGEYWELINGGSGGTTLNGAASGATFNVTNASGIAINDIIGVTDDLGDIFATTVTNKVANQLTVSPVLPAAGTFSSGNTVIRGVLGKLNGSDDHQVDADFMPGTFWLIVTNNVDVVLKYDGSTMQALGGLSAINVEKARTICVWANLVFLGNLQVAGTAQPHTVRWCDAGAPEVWNAGIAGFENLFDTRDPIVAIRKLGDDMIVYRTRSIVRVEYVGAASQLINFRTMIQGTSYKDQGVGPMSTHSVVILPDTHYFHSIRGIYAYRGGFSVDRVAFGAFRKVHDARGHLNRSQAHRAISFLSAGMDEIYFGYPKSDETYGKQAIVLSLSTGYIGHRTFAHALCGIGSRQGTIGLTYDDLVGTMAEQEWTADSLSSSASLPTILFCTPDLKTWEYDYVTPDDGGIAIGYELVTKEFRTDGLTARFDVHEFLVTASNMSIYYSIDGGASWVLIGVATTSGEKLFRVVPNQFVSTSVMYKFAGSGGGATISRILANNRLESRWGA